MANNPYIITTGRIIPPGQIQPARPEEAPASKGQFAELLRSELGQESDVVMSKHAQARLSERNISLTETHMERLSEAVGRADSKGLRDTLVLMDEMAFIVNVRSRTVVTAMDDKSAKENVFSNIDGAVII